MNLRDPNNTETPDVSVATDQQADTAMPVFAPDDSNKADTPEPHVTDVDTGPMQGAGSTDSIARVEANQLGITAAVFERAIPLTTLCRMSYPGGKDLESLSDHAKNRSLYGIDTMEAVELDSQRLVSELETFNQGKSESAHLKADIFRATKLQGVVYHSDEEIIVSFEGSDGMEWRHYLRNLIKSPISLQPKMFFHDLWRTGQIDAYEQKIQDLAERIAEPDERADPEKLGKIVHDLKNAKVHKGWWDSLNLPLKFGPGQEEGDTIWSGMERHIQKLEAEIEARTGKKPKLTFAGHSSGGSLSMIAAARWMENNDHMVDEIHSFGQPRTGTLEFRYSMYEFMDRDGKLPIYRFEMEGDPVPSLPYLASFFNDHLRHIGNAICIAPNGTLLGIRRQGKIVTAKEAADSIDESMTTYYRSRNKNNWFYRIINAGGHASGELTSELAALVKNILFDGVGDQNPYVTAPDHELEKMFKRRNIGRKYKDDPGVANLPGTLLDLASHVLGISAYRHVLPTMSEALTRQLSMEQLREKHGGCLAPTTLADLVTKLSDELHTEHQAGSLDIIPGINTLLATLDLDKAAFVKAALEDKATPNRKPGTVPQLAPELVRAAVHLGNSRSNDSTAKLDKLPEQASLVGIVKALKAQPETKELYVQAKEVLEQMEYFIARRVPIHVDKHAVRVLRDNHMNGNGVGMNGNGQGVG